MSQAIYLSPKAADTSALIFIKTNCHNPKGWIEKPNGEAIKPCKPLINEVDNATNQTSN